MIKLLQLEILNQFGLEEKGSVSTVVYLKENDEVIGKIELDDIIKKEAKETISELNKTGIKTKMLTGDTIAVASKVGEEIGIQEIKAELLPQDKYNEVENMKNENVENRKNSCICW